MKSLYLIILVLFFIFNFGFAKAQNGKIVFEKNCAACHKIGEGRSVGPDLLGISKKREEGWLVKFILSSQTVLKSGDKVAEELYKEYNNLPMPDQAISESDAKDIITYIATFDGATQIVTNQVEYANEATEENYKSGSEYFNGTKSFLNGGQSCISCHNITDENIIAGGNLAKDLSQTYNNLKGDGIKAMLVSPPFPAMTVAYKNQELTEEEIYDLTAFIKISSTKASSPKYGQVGKYFLMYGILACCIIITLMGLIWQKRRIRLTNQEIVDRQKQTI